MVHSIFLAYLSGLTMFYYNLTPSFLWPAYHCNYIIYSQSLLNLHVNLSVSHTLTPHIHLISASEIFTIMLYINLHFIYLLTY